MQRGPIQGLPKFFGYPLLSQERVSGKATDFQFGGYIYRANPNKRPLKFWRKWSVGLSKDQR